MSVKEATYYSKRMQELRAEAESERAALRGRPVNQLDAALAEIARLEARLAAVESGIGELREFVNSIEPRHIEHGDHMMILVKSMKEQLTTLAKVADWLQIWASPDLPTEQAGAAG